MTETTNTHRGLSVFVVSNSRRLRRFQAVSTTATPLPNAGHDLAAAGVPPRKADR